MKNIHYIICIVLTLLMTISCNKKAELVYLDQDFPGLRPKIYAPDVLSLTSRYEHGLAIRNNGQEHYFGLDGGKNWTYNALVCLNKRENKDLILDTLDFTNKIIRNNNGIIGGEPTFSLDGNTMYFVSDYPTNIWKVTMNDKGIWGNPIKLDSTINTEYSEWFPHIASDNALYYSINTGNNAAIYKAELSDGEYKNAQKLEAKFNYDCGDQVFSRNMAYIIFASPRKGGYGENDLYVAFKTENGEWTDGINLGAEINTAGSELAPYISPDNKYLFFTRRDQFNAVTNSDIYWVSLDIISAVKSNIK